VGARGLSGPSPEAAGAGDVNLSQHRLDTDPLESQNKEPGRTAIPTVLFLCVHNAGRSQMALGWLRHLASNGVVGWSGGSEPASAINPVAVAVMAEVGIDIGAEFPKPWTDAMAREADVVVTMGCGDSCPYYPGTRREDWVLDDPANEGLDVVRQIRDEIEVRVRGLLASLGVRLDR
jgi:protein-tyrosine-phosphatase